MTKLRESTGVILWILVFAFGVIWVLQDSNYFDTVNQGPRDIAVVNGSAISIQDYNDALDQTRQQFNQRFQGQAPSEEMIEEQAYNSLIQQKLIQQEMERLGIEVTEDEVLDMVYGPNPHPIIRQQFSDSTGRVNQTLIQNLAQDPQMAEQWLALENYLKEQRRQQKLQSVIQATVHVSEEDVREQFVADSAQAAVRYVAQRYATIPDDSITVTDADLRAYYDENQDDFEQPRTYSVDYVSAPKIATAQDTTIVTEDLEELRDEFASAEDDSLFLARNDSRTGVNDEFQTPADMPDEMATAVFSNVEIGRVAGPIYANDAAHLVKILEVQPADEAQVKARHILLRGEDTPEKRARLDSIRNAVGSLDDFIAAARSVSEGPSGPEGGDLGWFTRERMVTPFSDAAFDAPTGEIVGPVQTDFGLHLIWVEARADQAVRLADLSFSLSPGPASLTEQENNLEDVAYYAEDGSSTFTDEAESRDYQVQQVDIQDEQVSIPGIGRSRSIATYLDGASEGEISPVFELPDKFVLLRVTSIREEGYRPFDQVQAQIRPRVEIQKKRAILTRQMERAMQQQGSLDGLASALGTRVRQKSDLKMTTTSVPGVGSDPTFAGTVFGLGEGKTSGVVEGENAAFIVEVTQMTMPGELPAEQRRQLRQRLAQQRQRQVTQQWIASLRDRADIEDNRRALLNP